MTRLLRPAVILAVACLTVSPSAAQEITWSGELRPRSEARTLLGEDWDFFTTMRTRLAARVALEQRVSFYAQVQDVRFWGGEDSTTDFSAEGWDLHQGFADLGFGENGLDGFLRVGRQEVTFGAGRLVAAPAWLQQSRSFDGVRLRSDWRGHYVDILATKISENSIQVEDVDADFIGVYGGLDLQGFGDLELFWLLLNDSRDDAVHTGEHTLGGRWLGEFLGGEFRLEGTAQVGERNGDDLEAFMVGARWGRTLGASDFGGLLWYDYLSGDPDPGDDTAGAFNTLFATNHGLYGLYDLFLDIPRDTRERGLQDLALKTWWRPEGPWDAAVDLHAFFAAEARDLSTGHLADELDVTIRFRYSPNVRIWAVYSYVLADDGILEVGRLRDDAQWASLQLELTF